MNPMTPLEQNLNQLSLSTISRQLETTLTEAAAKNLSAAATLGWLADMEVEARFAPAMRTFAATAALDGTARFGGHDRGFAPG